jgi:hypothetical protein
MRKSRRQFFAARTEQAKRLGVSGLALHQAGVAYHGPAGDKLARDLLDAAERSKSKPSHLATSGPSAEALAFAASVQSTASPEALAKTYDALRAQNGGAK